MSLLPYAQAIFPRAREEDTMFEYMRWKDQQLEWDTTNRIYGIKNKLGIGFRRIGYILSRDFYEGDHWLYAKEEGGTMNVVNFCRMTVDNMTAFLTQEEPEIDIPPRDVKDELERIRVSEVEKLVKEILDENDWYNVYYDAVQNGSILGDSIIVGPFYDDVNKRIKFWNIKRPEYVRVIWKNEDYDEILGFILHYYLAAEEAVSRYGDVLREKGIDPKTLGNSQEPAPTTARLQSDKVKRVLIREMWDDKMRVMALDDHQIKYDTHNFGFVPIMYVRNVPHPYLPWGTSDIEDLVEPNKSYNELSSDMQDILKQIAFPSIFGKNLDVDEVQAGTAKIYDMGEDSEVFVDPRKNDFPAMQTYIGDRKSDVDSMSGIPAQFQGGGKGVTDISGRALSVIMTPINNKVRGKEHRWGIAIKHLVQNIEVLLQRYVPDSKVLIQDWFKVEVFFPGTLIRDVTEELNKFIQKTQSQYTTMKNIGISSPKDEQELIKQELSDPQLLIELSKNPQMQSAIAQQLVAGARSGQLGAGNQPGDTAANNANGPVLSQSQNNPGEQPAAAAGNRTPSVASPQGAVQSTGAGQATPNNLPRK